jgi:RHS repeat-associated protein
LNLGDLSNNSLRIYAPANTPLGEYKVRLEIRASNYPYITTAYSATVTITEPNLQQKPGTQKKVIFPDGSVVPFNLPTTGDYCFVSDHTRLQIWRDPDGSGYRIVSADDQKEYRFRQKEYAHNWHWPVFQITGTRYALSEILDTATGKSLHFDYVTNGQYAPAQNKFSQIKRIKNSNNDVLLEITHTESHISSVTDIYNRMVTYTGIQQPTLNPNTTATKKHWELATVSQVNSTNLRYKYEYIYVGNGGTGLDPQGQLGYTSNAMLHKVYEPRMAGLTCIATINYTFGTGFASNVVDSYGFVSNFVEVDVFGNPSPLGAYLKTSVNAPDGALVHTYTSSHTSEQNVTVMKDGAGIATATMVYNDPNTNFSPSSVTDALGRAMIYTYDSYRNVLTSTTPKGLITNYTYDYPYATRGRLTQVQEGTKAPTNFEYYEPGGMLSKIISLSPTGTGTVETVFTYNELWDVLTVTSPGEGTVIRTITFNYTNDGDYSQPARKGQPLVITDSQGNTMRFRYDNQGRVIARWDAQGNHVQMTYNTVGQVLSTVLPGGQNPDYTLYEYVYVGGPVASISAYKFNWATGNYVLGRKVTYQYGLRNETLRVLGDTGELVEYHYDGINRVIEVVDGRGNVLSSTQFNLRDLVESTSRVNTNATDLVNMNFVYNDAGQIISQSEYFTANGNVTGTVANLVQTNFAYQDVDGLLTQIAYPQQVGRNLDFTYDLYGRVTRIDDATGYQQFVYNDLDMVKTERTRYKAQGGYDALPVQSLHYYYNSDGSLKRLNTPAGDFKYDYDALGRLRKLINPFAEDTYWGYQTNSWLASQVLDNGVRTLYTLDEQGRMVNLVNRWKAPSGTPNVITSRFTVPSTTYNVGGNPIAVPAYDAVDNRLAVESFVRNLPAYSGMTQWVYDNQNRLIGETSNRLGGWNAAFGYDASGNITNFKGQGRVYDKQNQLKSGTGLGAFTYDAQGNARKHDGRAIAFSVEGKPVTFAMAGVANTTTSIPALKAEYRGDGLRAWKEGNFQTLPGNVVKGTRRYYLYAGTMPIIELDPTGAILAVNTFGANGLVSRRNVTPTGSSSVFYTFDERGNTVQRFDASGNVLSTRATDAYGMTTGTVQNTILSNDPYDGFGGQFGYYSDAETGFILCSHRYYDPKVGRWINRDPISFVGGINLYAYCQGNPINFVDPSGLSSKEGTAPGFIRNNGPSSVTVAFDLYDGPPGGTVYTLDVPSGYYTNPNKVDVDWLKTSDGKWSHLYPLYVKTPFGNIPGVEYEYAPNGKLYTTSSRAVRSLYCNEKDFSGKTEDANGFPGGEHGMGVEWRSPAIPGLDMKNLSLLQMPMLSTPTSYRPGRHMPLHEALSRGILKPLRP